MHEPSSDGRNLRPCGLTVTAHLNVTRVARVSAVIFSACLFTIGSIPAAGLAFPGIMHWVAHTTAYAMIAFATSLGWEKWPVMRITAVVVAIGAIHETSEIITHNHGLEIKDIMVNTIGALLGVAFQRITKRVFLL